ncbi:glycosyltransferase family protein [Wenzhouxiangella sp. EGI_FJ10305]|uniref:glycosyltransferase family protein n=1 Tax=Wenzhouxiangella sp. EGI_FJ10305 TaxID=3243768 RepID=UPI0035E08F10
MKAVRWLIKAPSPEDRLKRVQWGDTHFAEALCRALALRHHVEIDHRDSWEAGRPADVVVVLRGLYRYDRSRSADPDALHVLWLISHPDDVTDSELGDYDLIFVASSSHARDLEARFPDKVYTLLQCTNTETFFPPLGGPRASERSGVIFVGNTRGQRRIPVEMAEVKPGIRLHGVGWDTFGLGRQVATQRIDNHRLGELYRRARIALNDHWADMLEYGYLNNRVFDALACGLPVLTDATPEVERIFGNACGVCEAESDDFMAAYREMLLDYPRYLEEAADVAGQVCREHGFGARARELENVVMKELGNRGVPLGDRAQSLDA